jgi:hypothetical protein
MAMQAANESLATSFRIKETLARKMRNGKPMGGGRCYGFETGGEVQVAAEVAVLREIANRMLAGEPLQLLAAEMNGRGLRTVRGGEWNGRNLGRLLGAARYGGLVEHHGEIVGTMAGEPVLDRDTYDTVNALLASRRRGRRPTGRYLLTGLLTCARCRHSMNGAMRHKPLADGTRQREYRCPVQLGGCGLVILADPVEQIVGEHMVGLLADPENAAAIVAEDQVMNEARAVQSAKLGAVEDQLIDLEVKKAAGEIIERAYDKAKPVLDGRRTKLLAVLKELSPAAGLANYDARLDWTEEMTDEERREVIVQYRVRIEIKPMQPGTRRFDPNRVVFPPLRKPRS